MKDGATLPIPLPLPTPSPQLLAQQTAAYQPQITPAPFPLNLVQNGSYSYPPPAPPQPQAIAQPSVPQYSIQGSDGMMFKYLFVSHFPYLNFILFAIQGSSYMPLPSSPASANQQQYQHLHQQSLPPAQPWGTTITNSAVASQQNAKVDRLVEMGFLRSNVERVLSMNSGNEEAALNSLLLGA